MSLNRDDILNAALGLSEDDRLLIATKLLETVPERPPGLDIDDPQFFDELDRRSQDAEGWVPLSELWNEDGD